MPTELEFEIYAEKATLLPNFTGHISRGLLLHMLHHVDPSLSQGLHEPNLMKPYSVTPLYFRSERRTEDGYILNPQYPARCKVTFLEEKYLRQILEYFNQKNTVTIKDTTFQISSIRLKNEDYPKLEREAQPLQAFRLVFKTPTYLASYGSGYYHLFPDPLKTFSNLMRLWSQYSTGHRFTKEEALVYKAWLQENIGVSGYELTTKLVNMGSKMALGFYGWANYHMRGEDEWRRTTALLARFAEYSHIGGNRTGGFGVTRFIPEGFAKL